MDAAQLEWLCSHNQSLGNVTGSLSERHISFTGDVAALEDELLGTGAATSALGRPQQAQQLQLLGSFCEPAQT